MKLKEQKKNFLTQEGAKELKKELDYLITIKRPEVIISLKEARALGDLSENADYDAARNDQAHIESKIIELEETLSNLIIIKETHGDKVDLGSKVIIEYVDDNEQETYKIVGSKEADPFENKISNESPIAKAILGHKKGDTVKVESPNGEYKITVINIA